MVFGRPKKTEQQPVTPINQPERVDQRPADITEEEKNVLEFVRLQSKFNKVYENPRTADQINREVLKNLFSIWVAVENLTWNSVEESNKTNILLEAILQELKLIRTQESSLQLEQAMNTSPTKIY